MMSQARHSNLPVVVVVVVLLLLVLGVVLLDHRHVAATPEVPRLAVVQRAATSLGVVSELLLLLLLVVVPVGMALRLPL